MKPVDVASAHAVLGELARQLGHDDLHVEPTRRGRWRAYCGCGFGVRPDGNYASHATQKVAAETLIWHVNKEVNAYLTQVRQLGLTKPGVSLPENVSEAG